MRFPLTWPAIVLTSASLAVGLSCSGGGGGGQGPTKTTGSATVNVTLNDPETCASPQGPYSHIYLTIADVRANPSATALPTEPGWVDLTPNLSSAPVQIDLIGNSALQCALPSIATGAQIAPAVFQQVNVTLLDNSLGSKVSSNNCGAATNCVVLASNNSIQAIAVSGEAQAGISIPPTQITTGGFRVDVNQTRTLNLNVNSCASIVTQSNGQLRLKPVMFAGEINAAQSISGKIVDGVTLSSISGGRVVVALEQKDATGIDRLIQAAVPDGAGAFSFCSLPSGNYDVVAIATNGLNVAYGATITMDVPAGNTIGSIPLFQQPVPNQTAASISGQVTTANVTAGTTADVSLSILQSIPVGTTTLQFTVPQVAPLSPTVSLPTEAGIACPSKTDCTSYTLTVPVTNPSVGSFVSTGTTYSQVTGNILYVVDALTFVPGAGITADCIPAELKSATIAVTAGATAIVPVLNFTGCR